MGAIFARVRTPQPRLWLLVAAVAFLLGCSGGDAPPEPPPPPLLPSVLEVVLGADQVGEVGKQLPLALRVRVLSAGAKPLPAITVSWSVISGGGSLSASSGSTDAAGIAEVFWTLGTTPGTDTVSATVAGVNTVRFSATTELPAGAYDFTGPYPVPQIITYSDRGTTKSVSAFPGQVLIHIQAATPEVDALSLIKGAGGIVIGKFPDRGLYLARSPAGGEAALISKLQANSQVETATPHAYGTASGTAVMIDACSDPHGQFVSALYDVGSNSLSRCGDAFVTLPDGKLLAPNWKVASQIFDATMVKQPPATLLNISINGGNDYRNWSPLSATQKSEAAGEWESVLRAHLWAISRVPKETRDNLVVTISAGNINMPIGKLLSDIRLDPVLAAVLRENVLIVTTDQCGCGNHVRDNPDSTDRDVVVRNNPEAAGGTSYAAPQVLAIIENVGRLVGVDAKTALQAAKVAAATNFHNVVTQSEAIDKARDIVEARKSDASGASTVTAIAFLGVGSTTTAVISPAIAAVTVAYTVSGSDGYYDSGRLQTDASGRVAFSIPPGAHGVKDAISVTAVLSGKSAKRSYAW